MHVVLHDAVHECHAPCDSLWQAWGGCCMLRTAELTDEGPGSLLFHWQANIA